MKKPGAKSIDPDAGMGKITIQPVDNLVMAALETE